MRRIFFCAGIFDDEAKEGEEKPTQKKRAGRSPALPAARICRAECGRCPRDVELIVVDTS